jgi:hypothetical protein
LKVTILAAKDLTWDFNFWEQIIFDVFLAHQTKM